MTLNSIYNFVCFYTENSFLRLRQIGIALGIFLMFLIFRKIFTKYIFKLILKLTSKTKTTMDDNIVFAFKKPITSLFVVLGLYTSLHYLGTVETLPLNPFHISLGFIKNCWNSAVIILTAWGVYNLTGDYSLLFDKIKNKYGIKVDNVLFPFVSKCLRAVIIALAGIMVLDKWDYNIQGFITGLGLGGLAFALAAQDAVGNVIAGINIILDKPFSIGDWISTSEIEGVVEDISFRSTKIRTFSQEIVTVPNSNLANAPITNYAKRNKRRISFNLGVTYDTSKDKIEICVQRIRKMLLEHSEIHKDIIFVNFDKFNDSSLDLFLYFFTKTTDWGQYLEVKEDINLKIMEILEEEGVNIAFPSTSLYFETPIKQEKDIDIFEEHGSYEDVV